MIARDQRVWLGGYDITGAMNALGLELGLEGHDATVFGDTTRRSVAGLKTIRAEHQGYFDAPLDARLFNAARLDGQVMSVIVSGDGAGAAGSIAYSFPASVAEYTMTTERMGNLDLYQSFIDAADLRGEDPMEAIRRFLDMQNRLLYHAYLASEETNSHPIEEVCP